MSSYVILGVVFALTFAVLFLVMSKLTNAKSSARKKALYGAGQNAHADFDEETLTNVASEDDIYHKISFLGAINSQLKQGGLSMNVLGFLLVGLAIAVVATYFMGKLFANYQMALLICSACTFVVMKSFLRYKIDKRNEVFLNNFPDALDVIVRSIRTGQPLLSSLRMIAENENNDVSAEFQKVVDETAYGRPLTESLHNMADRVGLLEVKFFTVILSVQQETGGNLSEILGNLSTIIRKRRNLSLKIGAMTSEGRFTSWIFAAIPIVQLIAVSFMAEGYLDVLFKTSQGNILLAIAFGFIMFSVFMSKRMCKIDI